MREQLMGAKIRRTIFSPNRCLRRADGHHLVPRPNNLQDWNSLKHGIKKISKETVKKSDLCDFLRTLDILLIILN